MSDNCVDHTARVAADHALGRTQDIVERLEKLEKAVYEAKTKEEGVSYNFSGSYFDDGCPGKIASRICELTKENVHVTYKTDLPTEFDVYGDCKSIKEMRDLAKEVCKITEQYVEVTFNTGLCSESFTMKPEEAKGGW